MGNSAHLTSVYQIAKACGVDQQTASKWTRLAGFPAKQSGGWPRAAVTEYASNKLAEHAEQVKGKNADERREKLRHQIAKLVEDTRRARAEADIAERKNQLDAGILVSRSEADAKLVSLARLVKQTLDASKRELAGLSPDPAFLKAYSDKIDGLIIKLGDECEKAGL